MADGGAVASCNVDSEEGAVAGSGAPVFEETYMRFKWGYEYAYSIDFAPLGTCLKWQYGRSQNPI